MNAVGTRGQGKPLKTLNMPKEMNAVGTRGQGKPLKTLNRPKEMNAVGTRGQGKPLKTLNRPKEMKAVRTKVLLLYFPPVCPFAPPIFSQVTSYKIRHVLHLKPHTHVGTEISHHVTQAVHERKALFEVSCQMKGN
jgi:hypothetical protein